MFYNSVPVSHLNQVVVLANTPHSLVTTNEISFPNVEFLVQEKKNNIELIEKEQLLIDIEEQMSDIYESGESNSIQTNYSFI